MLRDNHICKVQSQNLVSLEQQHLINNVVPRYGTKNIGVIVLPLNAMFNLNPNMTALFAREAHNLLYAQGKCKKEDFENAYNLCAAYGVCMSNFFLAYSTVTNSMGLYTSSFSLLLGLAQKGILKAKKSGTQITEDLEKFKDALVTGQKIKNGFKTGDKLISVRLDPEVYGSTVYFKGTIPKTSLNVFSDFIFPLPTVNTAMEFFNNELQNKVLRFHELGGKVRACTKNIQVLSFIYGAERANNLVNYMYDARLNEFYVPSLGASKYTAGVTNIKFETVESIEELKGIADLDLTEVDVNYDMAQDYFCDRIISLNHGQLLDLVQQIYVPELNSDVLTAVMNGLFANTESDVAIVRDALKYDYAYKAFSRDIFAIIKRNPQYFGTINDYKLYCEKNAIGTLYNQVTIPSTVQDLQSMLSKGAFKILISSRNGGMSTTIVTNNSEILKKIYGTNYVAMYESDGIKIKDMARIIEKNKDSKYLGTNSVKAMFENYNMPQLVDALNLNEEWITPSDVEKILNDAIYTVESNKTVIKNPNNVTARSCTAHLDRENKAKDFYKMIDLKCIKEIIQIA